jgi:single-strand DNA-binding protein
VINKAIVLGSVGQDPEVRSFADGTAVCNVSVATNEQWKDKATGETKKSTEWHKVQFTGKLAEIVGEYVKKGQTIYVEGKIKTRKWTDKDGSEKYTTEIVANEMKMVGGKKDSGDDSDFEPPIQRKAATRPVAKVEVDDSSIPF